MNDFYESKYKRIFSERLKIPLLINNCCFILPKSITILKHTFHELALWYEKQKRFINEASRNNSVCAIPDIFY